MFDLSQAVAEASGLAEAFLAEPPAYLHMIPAAARDDFLATCGISPVNKSDVSAGATRQQIP